MSLDFLRDQPGIGPQTLVFVALLIGLIAFRVLKGNTQHGLLLMGACAIAAGLSWAHLPDAMKPKPRPKPVVTFKERPPIKPFPLPSRKEETKPVEPRPLVETFLPTPTAKEIRPETPISAPPVASAPVAPPVTPLEAMWRFQQAPQLYEEDRTWLRERNARAELMMDWWMWQMMARYGP